MQAKENRLKLFLASGFWLGLAPIVPGSFGALPALAIELILWLLKLPEGTFRLVCLGFAIAFSILHYWLTPWAQARWNDPDPSHFVLDEVVGALCVPILIPDLTEAKYLIAGFLLFRILDAIKLPGARWIDRNIHTASGVLFDDVVSAIWTAMFIAGAQLVIPPA